MTEGLIHVLRKRMRHPRLLTVIGVFSGMWWCSRCNASGKIGTFVRHRMSCDAARRPITWGPPNESRWIRH